MVRHTYASRTLQYVSERILAGYLGVRTHGVTSLIGVKSQWQNLELRDITSVKPSKLGARPIMDMVFTQPSPNDNITLMLVDNGGDIYSVNQDGLRYIGPYNAFKSMADR